METSELDFTAQCLCDKYHQAQYAWEQIWIVDMIISWAGWQKYLPAIESRNESLFSELTWAWENPKDYKEVNAA